MSENKSSIGCLINAQLINSCIIGRRALEHRNRQVVEQVGVVLLAKGSFGYVLGFLFCRGFSSPILPMLRF